MPVTSKAPGRSFTRVAVSFLVPAALVCAFLIPAAARRPLDEDEGYYALASKLVGHGKTPYTSFWYPQAPLMPYVYGAWSRVVSETWYVLRGLSVVLVIALACMVYRYVVKRWASRRLAVLAVLLLAATPLGFEWYPTVKTYALTTLLLFTAYVWAESSSTRAWLWAGLFLGLAIDVRLLVASVVIVFLLYGRRHVGQFLLGLALGLIPTIWLFAIGPRDSSATRSRRRQRARRRRSPTTSSTSSERLPASWWNRTSCCSRASDCS